MRVVDSTILAQLRAENFRPFIIFAMTVGATTYRRTDCDVPVTVGGYTYTPHGIKISSVKYSLSSIVDEITVDADNIDSYFGAVVMGSSSYGAPVTVSYVFMSPGGVSVYGNTSFLIFVGTLDSWTMSEGSVRMSIVSLFYQWSQTTLMRHSGSCRWKVFKGTDCAYAGAQTACDRTYDRCTTLANTTNYGGFRWLPDIELKEVWWGRQQK
jgi:hypothetical protein